MQEQSRECMCRTAVERAYRELRERDETDLSAFNAAAQVYRWYHPEVSSLQARFIIAEWLDQLD